MIPNYKLLHELELTVFTDTTLLLLIYKQSRESRRTVTRATLYCQLTLSTRN